MYFTNSFQCWPFRLVGLFFEIEILVLVYCIWSGKNPLYFACHIECHWCFYSYWPLFPCNSCYKYALKELFPLTQCCLGAFHSALMYYHYYFLVLIFVGNVLIFNTKNKYYQQNINSILIMNYAVIDKSWNTFFSLKNCLIKSCFLIKSLHKWQILNLLVHHVI